MENPQSFEMPAWFLYILTTEHNMDNLRDALKRFPLDIGPIKDIKEDGKTVTQTVTITIRR